MTRKLRILTSCAIFSALGFVLLYISSIIPSGRLAGVAVAGIVTAAVVIHCGITPAMSVFVATAVLGAVILPYKGNAILYALFFGYYPITKSVFERFHGAYLRWIAKLALFNTVFFVVWIAGKELLTAEIANMSAALPIAAGAANAAFIVFDLGLTKLICFYISRVSRYVKADD